MIRGSMPSSNTTTSTLRICARVPRRTLPSTGTCATLPPSCRFIQIRCATVSGASKRSLASICRTHPIGCSSKSSLRSCDVPPDRTAPPSADRSVDRRSPRRVVQRTWRSPERISVTRVFDICRVSSSGSMRSRDRAVSSPIRGSLTVIRRPTDGRAEGHTSW